MAVIQLLSGEHTAKMTRISTSGCAAVGQRLSPGTMFYGSRERVDEAKQHWSTTSTPRSEALESALRLVVVSQVEFKLCRAVQVDGNDEFVDR